MAPVLHGMLVLLTLQALAGSLEGLAWTRNAGDTAT
jgi:hypothetical protein